MGSHWKQLISILIFLISLSGNAQLISFVWHTDTLWAKNPLTRDSVQVSKNPLPWSAIVSKPSAMPPAAHTHTESEITNLTNDLAGKQNTITVLPFANGGISGSAPTSATTGTITVNMSSSIITCTPTGNMTLNASGGVAGQIVTFSFTTSGVTSFTITFGTNFRKTATLATGTTSARFFTVTFRCLDGTIWTEISRTPVQT